MTPAQRAATALLRELLAAELVQEPVCDCMNPWAHDQCTQATGCKINKKLSAKTEPVQEPVIWIQSNHLQHAQNGPHFARTGPTKLQSDYVPLYAHPPQQRVPLTKVQLWSLPEMRGWFPQDHYRLEALARAIERAHGITGEPT